jgi:Mlc titration factor MtfA (ptsG expression regulator)
VHPDQVVARREQADDDGVVHEYDEELVRRGHGRRAGDAVVARRAHSRPHAASGYNVVIHEFAHVLDMADGVADGVPLLPPTCPWRSGGNADAEFERFAAARRGR